MVKEGDARLLIIASHEFRRSGHAWVSPCSNRTLAVPARTASCRATSSSVGTARSIPTATRPRPRAVRKRQACPGGALGGPCRDDRGCSVPEADIAHALTWQDSRGAEQVRSKVLVSRLRHTPASQSPQYRGAYSLIAFK
jgi:hypothetical protein